MARSTVLILIAVAIAALGSLFGGAGYLEWSLPGGLPLGNALTSIGLSAAAGSAFGVSRPGTLLRRFSATSLVLSVAWLPVSIGLAGNLALNFDGDRGLIWIRLSLFTFALASISLISAVVRMLSNSEPVSAHEEQPNEAMQTDRPESGR